MIKKTKKIIIIEDDLAIVDIYKIIMKKAHLNVEAISSGGEAIRRIKEMVENNEPNPDIILIDLILPDINGMEVFRIIKENNQTKHIKTFILTNQENSELQWLSKLRPEKFLIKANTSPTKLLKLIKEELK